VLITGDYPGDGKPKPVMFPDPSVARSSADGWPVLPLRTLIELKLASAMSAAHRMQDYADAMSVHPWVAAKYLVRDHE
jgi:hypothetical protein